MTRALVQAEAGHALVDVLLKDAVANNLSNLQAAAANGELEPHVDIAELAEQLASQGWGLILLWMKGLVPLDRFEARSLRGLVTLLLAVTRGSRRQALTELLTQTTTLQTRGKSP